MRALWLLAVADDDGHQVLPGRGARAEQKVQAGQQAARPRAARRVKSEPVAVLRLPKDSHWKCDSYQHLKVTGQPFAMMNNLNDATSTRSFLDEPLEREQVP